MRPAGSVCWAVARILLWAALLAAPGAPVAAQTPAADSVRTLKAARRAQFDFEKLRRSRLPLDEIAAGRCEIRIGRFCYWSDPSDTVVPPEHRSVPRGRARLLTTLGALATRTPGDPWIAGQRVFYLVESGNDSAALRVARDCRSAAWWCAALRGYALHAGRDYAAADSAFAAALAAMPEKQRCRWRDVSLLLDGDARSAYQRLSCSAREAFESTLWWLSDPMYSVPGNERRTEHFARLTRAAIQADARTPYAMTWNDDFRELLVRYGASTWYTRGMSRVDASELAVSGHDPEPSYHFVADGIPIDSAGGVDRVRWDLDKNNAQERYLPGYAGSFTYVPAQIAMFRRGDSSVVVAAYDAPGGSGLAASADATAALALARRDGNMVVVRGDSTRPNQRVLIARTAWRPEIASVELLTSGRRAAVTRTPVGSEEVVAPGAPRVSDVLLLDAAGSPLASLLDAAPRALGSNVIRWPRRVGLYWEVYGRADSGSAPVSLAIARIDRGVLREVARVLRMRSGDSPLVLRWSDPVRQDSITRRSVVVDLRQLAAGRYRITLEVGASSGAAPPARTWRDVELK